jgi:hypothetical protein
MRFIFYIMYQILEDEPCFKGNYKFIFQLHTKLKFRIVPMRTKMGCLHEDS